MSGIIPQTIAGFKGYLNGRELEGVVDVELPSLEAMTTTVKGAGLLGETEVPAVGNHSAMSATVNWRVDNRSQVLPLIPYNVNLLEVRKSIQLKDPKTGIISTKPFRAVMRVQGKSTKFNKAEVAGDGDASNELTVEYLLVLYDNVPQVEYDPFNYVFRVRGVDMVASVKDDIN